MSYPHGGKGDNGSGSVLQNPVVPDSLQYYVLSRQSMYYLPPFSKLSAYTTPWLGCLYYVQKANILPKCDRSIWFLQ